MDSEIGTEINSSLQIVSFNSLSEEYWFRWLCFLPVQTLSWVIVANHRLGKPGLYCVTATHTLFPFLVLWFCNLKCIYKPLMLIIFKQDSSVLLWILKGLFFLLLKCHLQVTQHYKCSRNYLSVDATRNLGNQYLPWCTWRFFLPL